MGLRDFTLHTIVARNTHLHGARTAFVFEGQRITHAQYHARAERLAVGLHRAGLAHGDRLCILAQNRLEFLDAYAAAARPAARSRARNTEASTRPAHPATWPPARHRTPPSPARTGRGCARAPARRS